MMRKKLTIALLIALMPLWLSAQKVIQLYPDGAPGTADWTWQEGETFSKSWKTPIVFNVVKPTLTVYPGNPAKANGTAVIVCPGGGFYALSIKNEGTEVAKWLAEKGITVFVLRYRLIHSVTEDPGQEFSDAMKEPAKLLPLFSKVIPMAIADGKQAIAYVRSHATAYQVDPHKIGIIGFSAGGTVASSAAFNYTAENRPDFVAPVYAYVPPLPGAYDKVPTDAPPLFLAAATDDGLHLVPSTLDLYNKWLSSGHQAEVHIYAKGGHGFGMSKQHLPVDHWIDRFGEWLVFNGFLQQ
jgi:acetyl esterase/lipase